MRTYVYDEERVHECQKAIGYTFQDEAILLLALTHSSYTADKLGDNERLEFLGDAVLGAIVSGALYELLPQDHEGVLTERKSAAVRDDNLAQVMRSLGILPCFRLGRGVGASSDVPDSVCANIFEAIVAAIFLDGGFEAARTFVLGVLDLTDLQPSGSTNFKSLLQEYLQQRGRAQPVYEIVDASGPDHNKRFLVRALVDGETLGTGHGQSKKQAEQMAAQAAYERLI